jgi:cytochrome b6-f complex iron-sulfur subunit
MEALRGGRAIARRHREQHLQRAVTPPGREEALREEGRTEVSRRRLLDLLLSGSLLSFVAAVIYPVWRYMTPPRISEGVVSSVTAARVGELAPNTGKVFRFGSRPGILVRTAAGEWRAFSAVCTHLQCTVQYRPDLERIWCACHNGFFDLSGRNVAGPPPRPLETFDVAVQGEEVVVTRRA